MKENKNVPKLRFNEFTENWEETTLGSVSEKEMYGMNSASKEFDGENKYIRITDISENSNKFVPNPLTSPDGNLEDKFLLKKGDIVFARTGASTGKSYLYDINDGKLYFAGFLIKFHISKAIPEFIFYNTLRNNYNNWVKVMSVRSGQPGINAEEYKKLKIKFPSKKEQIKISSFLQLIDKKIDLLEKKLSLYQSIKKYLLNKIMSCQLRFNEFTEEWKKTKLNLISDITSSKRIYAKDYVEEGIPFYRGKEISCLKNKQNIEDLLYISEEKYNEIKQNFSVPVKNDILITSVGTLGNIYIVPDNKPFYFKDGNLIWLKNIQVNSIFLSYILIKNKHEILTHSIGSTQKALTIIEIEKLEILLPSTGEQTKIADFLSLIDKKIELLEKKLSLYQSFKQSLLQQMLI